jgi:hypothetical protein
MAGQTNPRPSIGSVGPLSQRPSYDNGRSEAARKSWAEFMEDPEWKKVQQESEVNGKLVGKTDSVFMEPTDSSPIK